MNSHHLSSLFDMTPRETNVNEKIWKLIQLNDGGPEKNH